MNTAVSSPAPHDLARFRQRLSELRALALHRACYQPHRRHGEAETAQKEEPGEPADPSGTFQGRGTYAPPRVGSWEWRPAPGPRRRCRRQPGTGRRGAGLGAMGLMFPLPIVRESP
ncbi:MAG: hypothetical protein ACRERE_21310 [Candidatus Entotheonellia bacterium]